MRLIGKYGEIKVNDEESVAVITNAILEQRYGSVVTFPNDKLIVWVKRLRVYGTEDGRVQISEW